MIKVGDIVLSLDDSGAQYPAIVVVVNPDGSVNLARFVGGGISLLVGATLGAGPGAYQLRTAP